MSKRGSRPSEKRERAELSPSEELASLWRIASNDEMEVRRRRDFAVELLARGADPSVKDMWGMSPLHGCVRDKGEGVGRVIEALVRAGAQVDEPVGAQKTPLMFAVEAGNAEAVEALIRHGASVESPGATGASPLMVAIGAEGEPFDRIIQTLLGAGAKVERKDPWGRDAMSLAIDQDGVSGRLRRIEWVWERGSPAWKKKRKATGIQEAAALGRGDLILWLLEQGAPMRWRDKDGQEQDASLMALERADLTEAQWERLIRIRGPLEASQALSAGQALGMALCRDEQEIAKRAIEWIESSVEKTIAERILMIGWGVARGAMMERGKTRWSGEAMGALEKRLRAWMEAAELGEPRPSAPPRKRSGL